MVAGFFWGLWSNFVCFQLEVPSVKREGSFGVHLCIFSVSLCTSNKECILLFSLETWMQLFENFLKITQDTKHFFNYYSIPELLWLYFDQANMFNYTTNYTVQNMFLFALVLGNSLCKSCPNLFFPMNTEVLKM